MAVWEEIVDYTVPSNTTQVDFTGLNITKDDFIKVHLTHVNGPDGGNSIRLYANDNNSDSNYWRQYLIGDNSSVLSGRVNNNAIGGADGNSVGSSFNYIKISENDKLNIFMNGNTRITTSLRNDFVYSTSTSSFVGGINKLSFKSARVNHFETGSRIQIYRLTAEKVADITVASNTTQVDITGLDIQKGSDYLLVSDVIRNNLSYFSIFPNNLTTNSDYYVQRIRANGSNDNAYRYNINSVALTNGKNIGYTHIKLSNIGAFSFQAYSILDYGTSTPNLMNDFTSSTYENLTNINSLTLNAGTNGIGTGSRFELYKLY